MSKSTERDMDEIRRQKRQAAWQQCWLEFLGIYPEAAETPMRLDRIWLADAMAKKAMEFEEGKR